MSFLASFLFIFVFSTKLSNTVDASKKMFRLLDSNHGSLVSEATALPTAPQPLPFPMYVWSLLWKALCGKKIGRFLLYISIPTFYCLVSMFKKSRIIVKVLFINCLFLPRRHFHLVTLKFNNVGKVTLSISVKMFNNTDQSRPLFRPFLIPISTIQIKNSIDSVLGIQTWVLRMAGTDKTT